MNFKHPAAWIIFGAFIVAVTAAFFAGRWTAPAHPSTNYVTTRTGGTGAIVTETHSGKVWTIDLRDTMNGKSWTPPAAITAPEVPFPTEELLACLAAFTALLAPVVWYVLGRFRSAPSAPPQ